MPIRLLLIPVLLGVFASTGATAQNSDSKIQLQSALYYDSNPFESVQSTAESAGFTFRGRFKHRLKIKPFTVDLMLVGQVFLDQIHKQESKFILNPSLHLVYLITPGLSATAGLVSFKKDYGEPRGAYQRSELNFSLSYYPVTNLTIWLARHIAQKELWFDQRYRYQVENTVMSARYRFAKKYFLEVALDQQNIVHQDVQVLEQDAVESGNQRADHGYKYSLHLQYKGQLISGFTYSHERSQSNSLAGYYNSTTLNFYISASIGQNTFAHLSLRGIYKRYRYEQFEETSYYLDPEEPLQNLGHFRLEHKAGKRMFYYFQISVLENETTVNHVYYNKTLFEIGTKYNF